MKFFLVAILVILPSLGFSQEGEMTGTPADALDEKAVEELEGKREEQKKALQNLQESFQEGPDGPTLTPEEQMKKLDPNGVLTVEGLKQVEKVIREAKMWELPEETVRREVVRSFQGGALEGFVNSSPRLQNFMVDFLRDKDALLNSIAIMKDRDRLKTYLYVWIGVMFASYYTRRLFISKYWKKPVRTLASILFTLTISVITLSAFCLIFSAETKPIVALVKKHI